MTAAGGISHASENAVRSEILAGVDVGDPGRILEALSQYCAAASARVREPAACWPGRCAGTKIRIGLLANIDGAALPYWASLSGVLDLAGTAEARIWQTWLLVPAPRLAVEAANQLRRSGVSAVAFGGAPTALVARTIADLDLDLVVDLAGLSADTAALLAHRPARAIVGVTDGTVLPHVPPLVDRLFLVPGSRRARWTSLVGHRVAPGTCVDVGGETATLSRIVASAITSELDGPRPPDCPLDPKALRTAWHAALQAHRGGNVEHAAQAYAHLVEVQPLSPQVHCFFGRLLQERGRPGEAAERLRRASELAGGWAAPRLMLAQVLAAIGNVADAASEARRLLADSPEDADLILQLGNVLRSCGQLEDAASAFEAAANLDPKLEPALFNAGVANAALRRMDRAAAFLERLLGHAPRHVLGHRALCDLLREAGRYGEWLAAFRRFEAACPDAMSLAAQGLEAHQYLGDPAAQQRYLDGIASGRFRPLDTEDEIYALEQLLYLLLFFDIDPQVLLRLYRRYDALMSHSAPPAPPAVPTRRAGRVRIGYLSADLRDHVMGKMMWDPIRRHDTSRFEVYCYALNEEEDDWTRRFEGSVEHFVRLGGLDDRTAVRRMARDDLDLLVDLCAHTRGARPAILAAKPARVAITHVATAGAVGLRSVDFKLTDHYADLPENGAYLIERLLPMEGCVYPLRRLEPSPGVLLDRAAAGIGENTIVVGAFFALLKLSPRCLRLWREILERLPGAKIAFSPNRAGEAQYYARVMASAGIARDRFFFLPQGRSEAENQARYHLVDFVLDSMPYGGVNGTLEALAMGVPVVTLRGSRHQERTGSSILVNLGVTELVAASEEQYVAQAVRLGSDREYARAVRQRIDARLRDSSLADGELYTRRLERAYVAALVDKGLTFAGS